MNPTPIAVWYSSKHAELYKTFHNSPETRFPETDIIITGPCHKNFAVIDGVKRVYTALSVTCDENEPFEGALKRFPDYKLLGYSLLSHVTTKGIW